MPASAEKLFPKDNISLRRLVLQRHFEQYIQDHFYQSQHDMDSDHSASMDHYLFDDHSSLHYEDEENISEETENNAHPSSAIDVLDTGHSLSPMNTSTTREEKKRDNQPQSELPFIQIDASGRLELIVGSECDRNGVSKILVSEGVVRRLSTLWAELIATCTNKKRWGCKKPRLTLRLAEDDPKMMAILMQIAHLKFAELPQRLDFDEIVELVAISSRFGTNELLIREVPKWISPYRSRLLEAGFEEWLFIAYQFGFESEYLKVAKNISMYYPVDDRGELIIPGTDLGLTGNFPLNTLRAIKLSRMRILAVMLNSTYEHLDMMQRTNTCTANEHLQPGQATVSTEERTTCTSVNHTGLMRYLYSHGYWPPIANASTIKISLHDFAQRLINSRVHTLSSTTINGQPSPTHEHCNIGPILAARIQDILTRMEWPVEFKAIEKIRYHAGQYRLESQNLDSSSSIISSVL